MLSRRKTGKLGKRFASGWVTAPSQLGSSKPSFSLGLVMGGEMVEVLVPTVGTHSLFLYRDVVPLCFLTLKAGGGEGRVRRWLGLTLTHLMYSLGLASKPQGKVWPVNAGRV